jgi:uncharacterized protein
VLVDANVLLYSVDEESPHYAAASTWLTTALNGDRRVALPWQTLGAFVRIATHPRVMKNPLSAMEAARYIDAWLACSVVWVPPTSTTTARLFSRLIADLGVTGNLVTDAQLAAIALEHGLVVVSADSDFARFPMIRWENPISSPL